MYLNVQVTYEKKRTDRLLQNEILSSRKKNATINVTCMIVKMCY